MNGENQTPELNRHLGSGPSQSVTRLENHVPSSWDRGWAFSIDGLITMALLSPITLPALFKLLQQQQVIVPWPAVIFYLSISFFYEVVFTYIWGRTPGKWMIGLRVVPVDNKRQKLKLSEAILRALSDRLTLFFGNAPYFFAWYRYDRTHVLDWIAGTRVVAAKPRAEKAKLRPVLATVLIVYSIVVSWRDITRTVASLKYSEKGVEIEGLAKLLGLPVDDEFHWNPDDFGGSKGDESSDDSDEDSNEDGEG